MAPVILHFISIFNDNGSNYTGTVQCACCVLCYFAGRSICYKTDNMGKRLLEIGMFGKGLGEFNEPSGITKEGNNIILVADSRNDRIQVNH